MRIEQGFGLDPSCKLWLPFYKYGAEQPKIYDQSGHGNHGTITGAVPAIYLKLGGINSVANFSFENGNPPTNFTAINTPEVFDKALDNRPGSDGIYCAHVEDSVSSYGGFESDTWGKLPKFKVSFWYKIISGSIWCLVRKADDSNWFPEYHLTTTGSWQYFECILSDSTVGTSQKIAFCSAGETAVFYIDDVDVQEVTGNESLGWQFDGVDDYISTGVLPAAGQYSWNTWVRIPTLSVLDSWLRVLSISVPDTTYRFEFAINEAQQPNQYSIFGDGIGWFGTGIPVIRNQWEQLTMVSDDNNIKIYKSGVLGFTSPAVDLNLLGTEIVRIAADSYWPQAYLKMRVGDFVLLNRALSDVEIKNYFERTRRIFGV